jgi:hypothetical protein
LPVVLLRKADARRTGELGQLQSLAVSMWRAGEPHGRTRDSSVGRRRFILRFIDEVGTMCFGMKFAGFLRMMGGVKMMSMGDMGMMRSDLMVVVFVKVRCMKVMLGSLLKMLRGLAMMFGECGLHGNAPIDGSCARGSL